MAERIIQTITMPNGVVVEGFVDYADHVCQLCSKTAIVLDIPRYKDTPRWVDDKWCWDHCNVLWAIAVKVSEERAALEKRLRQPLSLWKPHTWWRARVYCKWHALKWLGFVGVIGKR